MSSSSKEADAPSPDEIDDAEDMELHCLAATFALCQPSCHERSDDPDRAMSPSPAGKAEAAGRWPRPFTIGTPHDPQRVREGQARSGTRVTENVRHGGGIQVARSSAIRKPAAVIGSHGIASPASWRYTPAPASAALTEPPLSTTPASRRRERPRRPRPVATPPWYSATLVVIGNPIAGMSTKAQT